MTTEETIKVGSELDRTTNYGDMYSYIQDWFATMSRNKLAGKSPTISGITQKYLNEIILKNKLNTLLRNMTYNMSVIGEIGGTITLDNNGVPIFMLADTIAEHTRIGGKIVKQRHITNYTVGTRPIMLDEHFYFDNGVATVERVVSEVNDKGEVVEVQNGLDLLGAFGLELKDKETFDTGLLPCFHIENLPTDNGRGRDDLYGAEALVIMIQRAWNRLGWDYDINLPRIYKLKQAGSIRSNDLEKTKSDYVGQGLVEEIESIGNVIGESGSPITIYQSQYQGDQIFKTMKSLFTMIFEKQGFARDIPSEKGTAQETDFQLQQARNSEYTSFITKEDNLQQGLYEMFYIGLTMAGKPTNNLVVSINTVEVRDPMSHIELLEKAYDLGVISKKDAVKDYNKIDEAQAENKLEEIDSEKEQAVQQAQDNMVVDNTLQDNVDTTQNDLNQEPQGE